MKSESVSGVDMSLVHGSDSVFGVVCGGSDQEQAIALILAPHNQHTRIPPPYWDFLFHYQQPHHYQQDASEEAEEELQWMGGSNPFAKPKPQLPSLPPVQEFSRLRSTGTSTHPGALGFSLLHYACLYGQLRVVRILLGMGIDPNLPGANYDRHRPLHLAAMKSSLPLSSWSLCLWG